jgi:hypothetical protein
LMAAGVGVRRVSAERGCAAHAGVQRI